MTDGGIALTTGQRAQLERWSLNDANELRATRAKAVLLAARDLPIEDVATLLAVTPRSVARWIERFRASGVSGIDGTTKV